MTKQKLMSGSDSSSQVLQVLNNAAGMEYGVKAALAAIPDVVYPDNPAQKDVIPHMDSAYSSAAQFLTIFFSLMNVGAFWESAKTLYDAENKNLEKFVDVGFNFLKMGAWFTFIALITTGFVFIAPYLLIGMAALGIAYGTFNIVKHIIEAVRAHQESDKKSRDYHLGEIPKQMLLTAISALGLVFGIDAGITLNGEIAQAIKLSEAGKMIQALMMLKSVGAGFQGIQTLFYTLMGVATFGAISSKSTWEMNKETWSALRHPQQSFRSAKEAFIEKCVDLRNFVGKNPLKIILAPVVVAFELISLTTKFLARTIALVATPLLLIGTGIRKALSYVGNKIFHNKPHVLASVAPQAESPIALSTVVVKKQLADEHAQLKTTIEAQLSKLSNVTPSPKINAKKRILEGMKAKLNISVDNYDSKTSIDALESSAKVISPRVYRSFWRAEGKTEEIVRRVKQLDVSIRAIAG